MWTKIKSYIGIGVGIVMALLLGRIGLLGRRIKKKDAEIDKLDKTVKIKETQIDIGEVALEQPAKSKEALDPIKEAGQKEVEKMKEAKDDKEVVQTINHWLDDFNAK